MANSPRSKRRKSQGQASRSPKPSVLVLFLLILFWSGLLGWGLAQVGASHQLLIAQAADPATPADTIRTVDVVPQRYQLGEKIYLESCGSCHIALPPAILPTQTWQQLIQDPQHYGLQISPLENPSLSLVWRYLQTYSRQQAPEERLPYRISESRYFKALHPRVKLPQSIRFATCANCHPGAAQYNFRELTPEWEKAP